MFRACGPRRPSSENFKLGTSGTHIRPGGWVRGQVNERGDRRLLRSVVGEELLMPEVALHHEGHPKYRRMVRFDWTAHTPALGPRRPLLHPRDQHAPPAPPRRRAVVRRGRWEQGEAARRRTRSCRPAIRPFVRQEAWHAWAHQVVLRPPRRAGHQLPAVHGCSSRLVSHASWAKSTSACPRWMHRWWLNRRLAVVAAIEHFTCAARGSGSSRNEGLDHARAQIPSCSTCCAGTAPRRWSTARSCSTSTRT